MEVGERVDAYTSYSALDAFSTVHTHNRYSLNGTNVQNLVSFQELLCKQNVSKQRKSENASE